MKGLTTEAKVGAFVIMMVAILIVATFKIGKIGFGRIKGYAIDIEFDSIGGLEEKAPVRVAGVRVGLVELISLERGKALVRIRLEPGVQIREDSEVVISSLGLMGEKYVEISSGTPSKPFLEDGSRMKGGEAVDIDKLIRQLTDVAADIKVMTSSLREMFGSEGEVAPIKKILSKIDSLVSNVDDLIVQNKDKLSNMLDNFNKFSINMNDIIAENRDTVKQTIANFEKLSVSLNEKVEDISKDINEIIVENKTDIKESIKNLKEASIKLQSMLDSIHNISSRIERGEGTIGKLITDESAYQNLNQTLESINKLTEKIEKGEGTIGKLVTDETAYDTFNEAFQGINRYITRGEAFKTYLGFRSEYLTDVEEAKSYFSLKIQPTEDKYYLLEVIDDPYGKTEVTDTEIVVNSSTGTESKTIHEEVTEDELKFSLQIAQRFGGLTLRGGLIESTGGVAADYHLFGDGLELSLEAWDFNDEDNPHLKFTGRYRFYKNLFLNCGADDFINDDRSDFFVGGGLIFLDEDLKYLLGKVPIPGQ